MDIDTLTVSGRTETGKGPNRRLRGTGLVPAVIYGTGQEPVMVSLNARELQKALSKPNAETNLFNLEGEGKKVTAVIRELQRDPLTRRYLHVDLLRVAMDQAAEFEVPVHPVGTPVGVREGGMLETHLRSVIVRCLPSDLPEELNPDIAGIKINESFHVSDLQLPENITMVTEPNETLFAVHLLRVAATEETEEAPATQPEVIGKKEEAAE
jgi:large subunit ribosomal protein L25